MRLTRKIKASMFVRLLMASVAAVTTSCSGSGRDSGGGCSRGGDLMAPVVKISRSGGIPISPYAFGNNYFNWVDWNRDGMVALLGTEEPVKALRLNVVVGDNNQNDANSPQLFDHAEMDEYILYCRAVGAEPIMIAPVYGNNVDGGPTSAQGAADIVTYINGTKKYGVQYWTIGMEVDIYDQFFKTNYPVANVAQYAAIFKSYDRVMKDANAAVNSGVEMKFFGPELGWRYYPGNDWLTPMLDECKDYIDIVSVHHYGFAACDLTIEGALTDVDRFRELVHDLKDVIAEHARPGAPLAITEANISYDWDPGLYTPETRRVGPGTFYAAIWDAYRMGAALLFIFLISFCSYLVLASFSLSFLKKPEQPYSRIMDPNMAAFMVDFCMNENSIVKMVLRSI